MRPAEFWRSTAADVFYMAKGARRRDRHIWEKFGWLAANVMNPHLKRRITPKKLLAFLGPEEGKEPEIKSPEEIRKFIDDIAREQKPKVWTKLSDKYAPQDKEK